MPTENDGYEARVRANLRKFLARVAHDIETHDWADFEAGVIDQYVDMFMGSMHLDMPLSAKEVLDRGGAIRRVIVRNFYPDHPTHFELRIDSGKFWPIDLPEIDAEKIDGLAVTMLIEPIERR